jgi:two-component system LytT family response regulator
MLKAIVIDDEEKSLKTLVMILKEYCPGLDVVSEAKSALEGIREINLHKPDLVFLDIEMPNGSGFEMLESLPERNFDVIFVTAYNHYALKAIKCNASDYIIKPVDVQELVECVDKIIKRRDSNLKESPDVEKLLKSIRGKRPARLAVPTADGTEFISIREIIRIEAERSYCVIYMCGNRKLLLSRSLSDIEASLDKEMFFRAHKSHLVNLEHIKKHVRFDGGYIIMDDESKVELSRRKREEFLQVMNIMTGYGKPETE